MMPKPPGRLRSLYADLDAMSSLVRDAFRGAAPQMTPLLTPSSLQAWAEEGLGLARGGSRSWDAAAEYFRASPAMAQQLTARRFLGWARRGRTLAAESGVVAAAFYKASPAAIAHLPHSGINAWADMGQRLCTVADFADTLARRFFDASPRLLQYSPPETLEQLVRLLAVVTPHSLDMGTDVLNQAVRLFPDVRSRDLTAFLDDGERLAKQNHHAVRAYFDAGLAIYVRLGSADRDLYLELINAVAMAAPRSLPTYLSETARHLGPVVAARGAVPLVLSARIAGLSTAAAREFIRNAPMLTTKLTNDELTLWCSRGEALLANHEAAGIGYFRLQSREALEAVSSLSPAVELEEVREVLRLYCQALMGRTISIVAAEKVSERAATHWTSSEELDWEGAAIFCPSRMQEFPSKEGNFEAYKVLATHQAGHLEFGTFEFVFKSDGALLTPIRQTLADIMGKVRTYYTEFDQFFDLFSDRRLARDLFTIAEDTRIDHQVRDEYRGIRRPYRRVQENSAQGRPDYRHMPMREQFVEMLVRMSLEAEPIYEAPKELSQQLWVAAGLINLMNNHATAAEDAAEAAVRLYVLLRLVPNFEAEQFDNADWIEMDLSEARYDPLAEDRDQIIRAFLEVNQQQPNFKGSGEVPEQGEDDNEEDYKSPQGVGHRGDLKPELGQAIQKLQQQARQAAQRQPKPGEPGEDGETALSDQDYDMQMLQDLIDNAGELFEDWEAGSEAFEGMLPSLLIGGLLRNYTGNKDQPKALMQPEAPHLGEDEVQTTIYDEWDYRAKAYRPKWCQVRQRVLKEGSGEFYSNAVAEHRALVNAVRRQFEMLRPENLGK
ncbi:MAG: hypothetical protein NTZ05_18975, partial [Chloroflexi bacterium]|nr:hypothetical protein [Chloroflexota bacterium]